MTYNRMSIMELVKEVNRLADPDNIQLTLALHHLTHKIGRLGLALDNTMFHVKGKEN